VFKDVSTLRQDELLAQAVPLSQLFNFLEPKPWQTDNFQFYKIPNKLNISGEAN